MSLVTWETSKVRLFPVEALKGAWKGYPVRVLCARPSDCACQSERTLLVRRSDGGFVMRHCPTCPADWNLTEREFIESVEMFVACPRCKRPMAKSMIGSNYGFLCPRESCIEAAQPRSGSDAPHFRLPGYRLADLLPHWTDLE